MLPARLRIGSRVKLPVMPAQNPARFDRARIAQVALVVAAACVMASACRRVEPRAERSPPAPAKCKEAVVNPVSGYASCVDPLGAPVDPPPKRPN
jgi:hypothetical protein